MMMNGIDNDCDVEVTMKIMLMRIVSFKIISNDEL